MKIKEILGDIPLGVVFVMGLIFIMNSFSNYFGIGIAFLFFLTNYLIIYIHERKYKKNFPYPKYKSKNKIIRRILLGFVAGFHYLFFIGTYNHKKYNTQVYYPETLECYTGNISEMIILFFYLYVSATLFNIAGYYSLIFMAIPLITNILSMRLNKNRIKRK